MLSVRGKRGLSFFISLGKVDDVPFLYGGITNTKLIKFQKPQVDL